MEEITVRPWIGKDYLTLKKDSVVVFQMNKERVIPISQIISFEVKDPKSRMRPGMITIQLGGAPSSYVKMTSFLSVGDSGNVEFPHSIDYKEEAQQMKKYIENYKSAPAQSPSNVSVADEIKKFKDLLDCGAITEEEYEAKKKELLNL